jgi:DNA-binding FadR family transcriptional regulator
MRAVAGLMAASCSELTEVAESHRPVLAALRTRDPDLAEEALREHVLAAAERLAPTLSA